MNCSAEFLTLDGLLDHLVNSHPIVQAPKNSLKHNEHGYIEPRSRIIAKTEFSDSISGEQRSLSENHRIFSFRDHRASMFNFEQQWHKRDSMITSLDRKWAEDRKAANDILPNRSFEHGVSSRNRDTIGSYHSSEHSRSPILQSPIPKNENFLFQLQSHKKEFEQNSHKFERSIETQPYDGSYKDKCSLKFRESIKPYPSVEEDKTSLEPENKNNKFTSSSDNFNLSRITKKRQVEDRKRNRTTFTVYQTDTMETEFKRNPYPKEASIQNLILMTGVSSDKIRVWFKNRRAKIQKRKLKEI